MLKRRCRVYRTKYGQRVLATVHGGHDALLEFLFGCDLDVAQDGAGELGEETLDEIEPGAVLGREGGFEATGKLLGEPSLGEAIVGKGTTRDDARQRLDALTVQAANPDVFLLLEFALSRYVRRAGATNSPSDRVRRLLMVPEAVLQSLAARFCGIVYASPPETLPAGPDYDSFFEGRETFRYGGGRKLEMTALLVIVPAIFRTPTRRRGSWSWGIRASSGHSIKSSSFACGMRWRTPTRISRKAKPNITRSFAPHSCGP